jgi:hypothetical protein
MAISKEHAHVTATSHLCEDIIILPYRPEAMNHAHSSILCMLTMSLERKILEVKFKGDRTTEQDTSSRYWETARK